jgi:NADH-quinone oxidoreductase subunit J
VIGNLQLVIGNLFVRSQTAALCAWFSELTNYKLQIANSPMPPVATNFFFYVMAAGAVFGAIMVITRRNAVHSALWLISTLLAITGLYLMLYAPFVAAVQVVIYAGGIMVLFLFVIMLVNLERSIKEDQFSKQWLAGVIASLCLAGLFALVYEKGQGLFAETPLQLTEGQNTQQIGIGLYQNYALSFEIASLLLLVAIVGAVVMAKKRI